MKLQLNDSGAWKTIATFFVEHLDLAQAVGDGLGLLNVQCGAERIQMRVLDGAEVVIMYWTPKQGWHRSPRLPADYEVLP